MIESAKNIFVVVALAMKHELFHFNGYFNYFKYPFLGFFKLFYLQGEVSRGLEFLTNQNTMLDHLYLIL